MANDSVHAHGGDDHVWISAARLGGQFPSGTAFKVAEPRVFTATPEDRAETSHKGKVPGVKSTPAITQQPSHRHCREAERAVESSRVDERSSTMEHMVFDSDLTQTVQLRSCDQCHARKSKVSPKLLGTQRSPFACILVQGIMAQSSALIQAVLKALALSRMHDIQDALHV